ncbi:hypothetical protein [Micromonospora humi]|uniref:Uncharacterized protein n=1 Tax=Micromonospora humi TaxID=745366 RepID=A0A1C5JDM4_9ACTN|nr:hypothetical protein [Micromonospora humi]SCG68146.1 hypothetical protein GA0070213_11061 [Micromonospora humi]
MTRFALVTTQPAGDPPALLTLGVWSTLVMATVFVGTLLSYLLRHRLERANAAIQGIREHEYVRSVQQPVAGVLVGAVGGYGINVATQGAGWPGYLGWLLGMPVPVAMVTWAAVRGVRRRRFDEQWPPDEVPADDPVEVRGTLRRVVREGAEPAPADPAALDRALRLLLDEVLPALRARRDRGPRRWLRDHRAVTALVLGWAALTLGAVAAVAVPHLAGGRPGAWAVLGGAALVIPALAGGQLVVLYRHSRFRSGALAGEVERSAGAVRRRITERRLGIAAESDGEPRRRRRPALPAD